MIYIYIKKKIWSIRKNFFKEEKKQIREQKGNSTQESVFLLSK